MSALAAWFARMGIARRLVFLFALLMVGLSIYAYFLSHLSERKVADIENVAAMLERAEEVFALQTAIADYAKNLDARQSLILNQDFLNLGELQKDIERTKARTETHLSALVANSPSGDVSDIRAALDAFRNTHDNYLKALVADQVVSAIEYQAELRRLRLSLDQEIEVTKQDQSAAFGSILGGINSLSKDFAIAMSATVGILMILAVSFIVLMFYWVVRPLNQLSGVIKRLDDADSGPIPERQGPAEFQSIARALMALRQRIREQRVADERMRRSEAKLRQYIDCSADMYWEMGSDFRFVWVDNGRSEIDLRPERVLGRTRWGLVNADPDTDPFWGAHRDDMINKRAIRDFVYPLQLDRDSELHWVRVSGVPFFDSEGQFQGYRGNAVNITEQRATAERLRKAQNSEALGRLAGGVAHDFNNLLMVLQSNLELLKSHAQLQSPFSEMVARCMRAIERGSRLASQLLSLGRRQTLNPVALELAPFLAEFGAFINRSLPKHISVCVTTPPDLPAVRIDAALLHDALVNLVFNARDAMPAGGTITIEAAFENSSKTTAASTATGRAPSRVQVSVSDTGLGISPQIREKVFEPFFSTKERGEGSGLGLSMVRGFIEQSGGAVRLESEEGSGTVITLDLPLGPRVPAQLAGNVPPTQTPGAGWGGHILIVEDDEDVRSSLVAILGFLHYRVTAFGAAKPALDALEKSRETYDAVLSDVVMPGPLQGTDLAAAVRKRHPAMPVVLMSGYTGEGLSREIAELDVPLLKKPVTTEMIERVLSEQLASAHGQRPQTTNARAYFG